MKVGLQIVSFDWAGGDVFLGAKLADVARAAEDAGFSSIWVMDHFFQIRGIGPVEDPMMEAYATLNYLAGVTRRVKLGAMVTGVIYREPALLVKTVTALDVLSGGRAYLGIGAAWNEEEATALGFPFPPLGERFERLEEALQIAKHMWAGHTEPYHGSHYHLSKPINNPQPVSKNHPPILIGGGGEKKTLRLVAQYGDACNVFAQMGKEAVVHKLDILKQHCEDIGRDYNEIERTALSSADLSSTSPAELLEHCQEMASVGIQHIIFNLPTYADMSVYETFGKEIIPAVAAL